MEGHSWTEVDDLRAMLGAADRTQFDAQLRELTFGLEPDVDRAFEDLLAHWHRVARATPRQVIDLSPAPRHPWVARLTASRH